MAKQCGSILIKGTLDELTFYIMDGQGYVRKKSSLTRKKFRTRPCFARSRESAARFGQANKLAARVYRSLGREERRYDLFCLLKRRAIALLQARDRSEAAVLEVLQRCVQGAPSGQAAEKAVITGKPRQDAEVRQRKKARWRERNSVKVNARREGVPEGLVKRWPSVRPVRTRRARRSRPFAPV